MAIVNIDAILNPITLTRKSVSVAPTTIEANDTLRVPVPMQGATTAHFANATLTYNNVNLSLATKSGLNTVQVFITNTSSEPVNITSTTLTVAIHS